MHLRPMGIRAYPYRPLPVAAGNDRILPAQPPQLVRKNLGVRDFDECRLVDMTSTEENVTRLFTALTAEMPDAERRCGANEYELTVAFKA